MPKQAVNNCQFFFWLAAPDTDFTRFPGISEAAENPYGEDDSKSPFPLQPPVKRSYAQNVTVWIKASGLQVKGNTAYESTAVGLRSKRIGWLV